MLRWLLFHFSGSGSVYVAVSIHLCHLVVVILENDSVLYPSAVPHGNSSIEHYIFYYHVLWLYRFLFRVQCEFYARASANSFTIVCIFFLRYLANVHNVLTTRAELQRNGLSQGHCQIKIENYWCIGIWACHHFTELICQLF